MTNKLSQTKKVGPPFSSFSKFSLFYLHSNIEIEIKLGPLAVLGSRNMGN